MTRAGARWTIVVCSAACGSGSPGLAAPWTPPVISARPPVDQRDEGSLFFDAGSGVAPGTVFQPAEAPGEDAYAEEAFRFDFLRATGAPTTAGPAATASDEADPLRAGRRRGETPLAADWRLEYQSLGARPGESGADLTLPDQGVDSRGRRLDLVDVSLAWDARSDSPAAPVTLSALVGVRAMRYGAEWDEGRQGNDGSLTFERREQSGLAAAPLAGVRVRWDLPGGFSMGAGSSWRLGEGADPRDATISADLGYDISPRVGLYVGYERMRAWHSAEDFVGGFKHDAVFARVSLSF